MFLKWCILWAVVNRTISFSTKIAYKNILFAKYCLNFVSFEDLRWIYVRNLYVMTTFPTGMFYCCTFNPTDRVKNRVFLCTHTNKATNLSSNKKHFWKLLKLGHSRAWIWKFCTCEQKKSKSDRHAQIYDLRNFTF